MKFVSVWLQAVNTHSQVVLYFVALDNLGEIWWLDSGQEEAMRWRPLPTHPGRRPRRRRR